MHEPVLLAETLELLRVKPDGKYVDGTLGLAGHAVEIARRLESGQLLGLDVDRSNLQSAELRLQPFGNRTLTRRVNFRGLHGALHDVGWSEVDGMLFDLGVSTEQLMGPALSFQSEGPLDMRLDPDSRETAASYLARVDEAALASLLAEYGEGKSSRRMSRAMLTEFAAGNLKTNGDLARLCERVIGRRGPRHPATRVFLALRSAVNDENGALKDLVAAGPSALAVSGRMAIITFHSIEDRIVKEGFRSLARDESGDRRFALVNKKPLVPTRDEQRRNPRSRSAKLRVLERVS